MVLFEDETDTISYTCGGESGGSVSSSGGEDSDDESRFDRRLRAARARGLDARRRGLCSPTASPPSAKTHHHQRIAVDSSPSSKKSPHGTTPAKLPNQHRAGGAAAARSDPRAPAPKRGSGPAAVSANRLQTRDIALPARSFPPPPSLPVSDSLLLLRRQPTWRLIEKVEAALAGGSSSRDREQRSLPAAGSSAAAVPGDGGGGVRRAKGSPAGRHDHRPTASGQQRTSPGAARRLLRRAPLAAGTVAATGS
jgi:hypothetical protein